MTPDNELVTKIKNTGDESALMELVSRHSGLYYKTVQKTAPFCRIDDIKDDFYRRKEAEIFKAANSFDESKGVKFSSWLANQTRYSCLSERSKENKLPSFVEFRIELGEFTEETPETDAIRKDEVKSILSFIKENFPERTHECFELKFFGNDGRGMNFEQIGEIQGISPQAAFQNYKKAMKVVKKEFKNEYLC